MTSELNTRPMESDLKDLQLFKSLFDNNDSPKNLDNLKWQYKETEIKDIVVDFAIDEVNNVEKIAAVYAVFPLAFFVDGKNTLAVQSLDTMTDKAYQGRGLFKNLAQSVYNRAYANGYKFVFGFPNGNSAFAFFNRLGWTEITEVPFKIKAFKLRYFIKNIPYLKSMANGFPNISLSFFNKLPAEILNNIKPLINFGPEVDSLWDKFSAKIVVGVKRDASYLNWRYILKPNENYSIYGYYDNNELKGLIVYCLKSKHGGNIGYIMELLVDPRLPVIGAQLLKFAVNDLKVQGCDACLAWNFNHSPNASAFKALNFFSMPKRLRPIELHFGVRAFDKEYEGVVLTKENWYLSYSDSDTV